MTGAALAPYAADAAHSRGRRYPEPKSRYRGEYQRDRDRIIHSTGFRRLVYKTQVFVNHEGDLYRTRMTHFSHRSSGFCSTMRQFCVGGGGDGVSCGFHIGLWRSLEAHLLWEQGVVSSNLTSPTEMEPLALQGVPLFGLVVVRAVDATGMPLMRVPRSPSPTWSRLLARDRSLTAY